MNIIFLDIDGVLNYSSFNEDYCIEFLINHCNDNIKIDENKLKLLSYICIETNSKIVLSSSWKLHIDNIEEYRLRLNKLIILFKKHNIDLYGITPNIPNPGVKHGKYMWKEYDIKEYLKIHDEIVNYCIIDDKIFDLESLKDHLVLTDEDYGLCKNHLEEIKKILKIN